MKYVYHNGRISCDLNNGKSIFVFGSNLAGRHGRGAAHVAKTQWQAKNGIGEGPQGKAYGIPTKDERLKVLSLGRIRRHVSRFMDYAHSQPSLTFMVTAIGTGLAGYSHEQIAPIFKGSPKNCVFPKEWMAILEGY